MSEKETITVSGITFTADQVKSVIIVIDKREITVGEKDENVFGFKKG